jgi:hypothetical protein
LQKGTSNILVAASTGQRQLKSLKDPGILQEMRYTQLLPPPSNGQLQSFAGSDFRTMDIRAENVLIPAQTTTYWCAIVELDEELKRRKHHAVKVKAKTVIKAE